MQKLTVHMDLTGDRSFLWHAWVCSCWWQWTMLLVGQCVSMKARQTSSGSRRCRHLLQVRRHRLITGANHFTWSHQ